MLSIVIPSYKGSALLAKNLPGLISFLRDEKIEHEIIVVDDGSNDHGKTREAALLFGCHFYQHDRNLGKGAAIKTGMLRARGEFRIFTDVDIPFDYKVIAQCLRYLDFKEFDVVIGDRTLPGSAYFERISPFRKLASRVFYFFVARLITGGFFDTQCGIKGFRAAVAEDIFSMSRIRGFAADIEMLYITMKRNYDIKRLPVHLRFNEGSSVKILPHSIRMLFDILCIRWNYACGCYRLSKQKA